MQRSGRSSARRRWANCPRPIAIAATSTDRILLIAPLLQCDELRILRYNCIAIHYHLQRFSKPRISNFSQPVAGPSTPTRSASRVLSFAFPSRRTFMAYIKSRKHARVLPPLGSAAAATLVALTLPVAAQTPPNTLKEVRVEGTASDVKVDNSANPKFTAPLVNTPQTIQIIPETVMREQGATTLTEALRNSPGVGTFFLGENGTTSTGDSIYMRGFDSSSSIFVDGIRDTGSVSRD